MHKRTSLGRLRRYRTILLRHQRHCGPQIHHAMTLVWWQRETCLRILRLTAGADCCVLCMRSRMLTWAIEGIAETRRRRECRQKQQFT